MVLNIGLDLRVISPTLFAMLVIMALVTTVATTPVLQLLSRAARPPDASDGGAYAEGPVLAPASKAV